MDKFSKKNLIIPLGRKEIKYSREDRTIKLKYVYLLAMFIGCFFGYAIWHDEQVEARRNPLQVITDSVMPLVSRPSIINLTNEQAELLKIAYSEGAKYGLAEYVQGILCNETRSGDYGKHKYGIVSLHDKKKTFGEQSYGVAQIQLRTAKAILADHPELGKFRTDEHLLVALLTDDKFNISLAAAHYSDLYKKYGFEKALLAYNRGVRGMRDGRDPVRYVTNTKGYIKNIVKSFNLGLYTTDKGPTSLK